MVVFLEGSPISTEELCQSDHWVLGHFPDQGHSPPIAQFSRADSSRKSLDGSKLLPSKNDGDQCILGTFNAAEMFWYLSSDLCLNTILTWIINLISWLGFCNVNCGTFYIDRCVRLSKSCPIN
jgi:hypothetical protein